jgi:hypothetical protein
MHLEYINIHIWWAEIEGHNAYNFRQTGDILTSTEWSMSLNFWKRVEIPLSLLLLRRIFSPSAKPPSSLPFLLVIILQLKLLLEWTWLSNLHQRLWINTVRHFRVCWYGAPSLTRGRVCLFNCCCFRQRSHSQVRVSRGSWSHFTVSDLRLSQPEGPGPCIYIP